MFTYRPIYPIAHMMGYPLEIPLTLLVARLLQYTIITLSTICDLYNVCLDVFPFFFLCVKRCFILLHLHVVQQLKHYKVMNFVLLVNLLFAMKSTCFTSK